MLLYLTISHRQWREEGKLRGFGDLREAIVEGAAQRIRPKLMTVLTDMVGLLPVMLSTGTGADLMNRIAAPLVGGLAMSFLLEPGTSRVGMEGMSCPMMKGRMDSKGNKTKGEFHEKPAFTRAHRHERQARLPRHGEE